MVQNELLNPCEIGNLRTQAIVLEPNLVAYLIQVFFGCVGVVFVCMPCRAQLCTSQQKQWVILIGLDYTTIYIYYVAIDVVHITLAVGYWFSAC